MQRLVDYLAIQGYLALSFDPPCTWESPGDIKDYTMTNYLTAINDIIEHFGNRPTVLIGHSRGGSMAMLAGTRNNCVTHIIAIMSHATPSKPREKTISLGFERSLRDIPSGGTRAFELPLSFFEDSAQYDMREALSHCNLPKLFVLGTQDTVVKPEQVREAYAQSADPKELIEINATHDYRKNPQVIDELNHIIGNFLMRTSTTTSEQQAGL